MKIGMVGLGRMGGNMSVRLIRDGHQVVGFARSPGSRQALVSQGGEGAASLEDLVGQLDQPRVVWLMIPSGAPTETTMEQLAGLLSEGDTVVDGGNSNWRETVRRSEMLGAAAITLLDCGTSGGIWGLTGGYCLMIGGDKAAFQRVEPVFRSLAPEGGYAHLGPSGSGHFVKMVHNGIEYGMLAAYGEGFEIMRGGPFDLDLPRVASIWRYGSVVRSWLLDLLVDAYGADPDLSGVSGYVEDSGEGRWTVTSAIEESVPAPITALALFNRFASRQEESYSAKVIAALRREFGGHAVRAETASNDESGRGQD